MADSFIEHEYEHEHEHEYEDWLIADG